MNVVSHRVLSSGNFEKEKLFLVGNVSQILQLVVVNMQQYFAMVLSHDIKIANSQEKVLQSPKTNSYLI